MIDEAMPLAFVGATLIDGTGAAPRPDSIVVVKDERIEHVGIASDFATLPKARIIDVTGKFVMPGLLDANVHLVMHCDPDVLLRYEPGCYDDLVLEAAQISLRSGITTVFDSWGPSESLRRVRDRINARTDVGSRIFFAGNIIGNGGPWSDDFFPYGRELNTAITAEVNRHWEQGVGAELTWMSADDVQRAVREYIKTAGVDFIEYASCSHAHFRFIALSPDAQRAIIDEARAAGIVVQTCARTPETLKIALDVGVDLLQNGNLTGPHPMPAATLDRIVSMQLPCVVTLGTDRFMAAALNDEGFPEQWRTSWLYKESNAKRLIEAGAKLLHATDGGVFGADVRASRWLGPLFRLPDVSVRLGTSHLLWHRAMIERGMTPMDALVASTLNIAQAYRKDDELGTLERGKRADLLVLNADPLADPLNYSQIEYVVKDGAVVDHESLPRHPILTRNP